MWLGRWWIAGIPGLILVAGFFGGLGLLVAGPTWGLILALVTGFGWTILWLGLAFVPGAFLERVWDAQPHSALVESWQRAVRASAESFSRATPPQFLVFSSVEPLGAVYRSAGGALTFLLSDAWIRQRTESELRESFGRAAFRASRSEWPWRCALAWVLFLLSNSISPRALGLFFEIESDRGRQSLASWLIALPFLAWIYWMGRWMGWQGEASRAGRTLGHKIFQGILGLSESAPS
ncbi:MAG: hypothetical protein RJB38_1440 [Pseudomonadota bacterium]|jgi:hypothetical protein